MYAGESAVVRYNNTSRRGHVEVVHEDEPANSKRFNVATQRGQINVSGHTQSDGRYRVLLYDASGRRVSATSYWYQGTNATPRVALNRDAANCASGMAAAWRNAPGHRYDWLGVFSDSADEPHAWLHTGAAIVGESCLDETTLTGTWPLPVGSYSLRLLLDDSYRLLAESAEFQIN